MKRYIAQYVPWSNGLYAVADTFEKVLLSDPKPYHEALIEANERNNGVYGLTATLETVFDWLGGTHFSP